MDKTEISELVNVLEPVLSTLGVVKQIKIRQEKDVTTIVLVTVSKPLKLER